MPSNASIASCLIAITGLDSPMVVETRCDHYGAIAVLALG
jgi:hypothetical protein